MSASAQNSLGFVEVAKTMRRLFGSRGGAARPDALVVADVAQYPGGDKDREAPIVWRKAKKNK